jgi:hypothetical protein
MRDRACWLSVVTIAVLALLAPATAQAQKQLPLGEDHGVRLELQHGSVVLVFTKRSGKLRQRVNSKYAWIDCTELGEPFTSGHSGNLDAPPQGRTIRTGFGAAGADFCRIFLRSHRVTRDGKARRVPRRDLLAIPLTQDGAVYLDEESKAAAVLSVAVIASFQKSERHLAGAPTYEQLVAGHRKLAKAVVALAAPGDAPPPKRVGYYSDGMEHTVVAVLSAAGKRLFFEQAAGNVISTNLAAYIFGDQR